jgi:hypothetical protein
VNVDGVDGIDINESTAREKMDVGVDTKTV